MLIRNNSKRNFEVEFFINGSEGLTIQELLLIDPEFRTFAHCKEILKHVKNVKFLEKYMTSDSIYELAKHFTMETYRDREKIFSQGDEASKFYIILEGSVNIMISHDAEYKGFKEEIGVNVLRKGDSFGEIALLYDVPRTASVISNEYTELIVLEKEIFRKFFDININPRFAHIIEFFRNFFPLFLMEPKQLSAFSGKSIPHKFGSLTTLARQGEVAQSVFFVRVGRLKVYRKILFKLKKGSKNIDLDDPSDPTPEEIEAGRVKEIVVEIDEILSGESIGDYEVIHKVDMKVSVITSLPSEVIMVYKADIRALPDKILESYSNSCKTYPEDEDIRNKYFNQVKWNNWKSKLKTQLDLEIEHKKKNFISQLRRPIKRAKPLDKFDVPAIMPQLNTATMDVLVPPDVARLARRFNKNYDLDPELQRMMNDENFINHKPQIKSGNTSIMSSLSTLHKKSLSSLPSLHHIPNSYNFKYVEPKHKSRETSQIIAKHQTSHDQKDTSASGTFVNIRDTSHNITPINLRDLSANISPVNMSINNITSLISPSTLYPNPTSKKMVKFFDMTMSTGLGSKSTKEDNSKSDIDEEKVLRPRKKSVERSSNIMNISENDLDTKVSDRQRSRSVIKLPSFHPS